MDDEQDTLFLTRFLLTSLIVIPNFIGNILVCFVVLKLRAFHTLINFLLVHLAITDIFVGIFALLQAIFEFAIHDKSTINVHICKLITNQHVVMMGVGSSYTTIVIVSILRYYGITKPMKSMTFGTQKLCYFIPFIWFISLVALSPRMYGDFSNGLGCVRLVAISKTSKIAGGISIVARGIILPVVTLTYTYRKIYSALRERLIEQPSGERSRRHGALKSANVLGLVIVAFIFCTVPYHLYGFVVSVLGFHHFSTNFLEMVLFCVFILGSSVNPYLYWFHCRRFRRMAYKMINYKLKKLSRIHPS